VFGAPVAFLRVDCRMRRPPHPGSTPAQRVFGRNHAQQTITPCITGFDRNHAHRESRRPARAIHTTGVRTTPCIPGNPHNAPSYNSLHNAHPHAARLAQRAFKMCDSPHRIKRRMPPTRPGRRTVEFSRRARAQQDPQKANDLVRAAVGWNDLFGAPVEHARVASRMRRPHPHRITPA